MSSERTRDYSGSFMSADENNSSLSLIWIFIVLGRDSAFPF